LGHVDTVMSFQVDWPKDGIIVTPHQCENPLFQPPVRLVVDDNEKIFDHHYGKYNLWYNPMVIYIVFLAYWMGQVPTKKVIKADMSTSIDMPVKNPMVNLVQMSIYTQLRSLGEYITQ
jgi:hypothetical protein